MRSGGIDRVQEGTEGEVSDVPKKEVVAGDDSKNRIQAARERFLARKATR